MTTNLRRSFTAVELLLASLLFPSIAGAQGVRPGSLLVYYGYPTSINGTWSVPAAAAEFGGYDYVVWGDGLDHPSHPDHANAVAILAHPSVTATAIFGYVDLGVTTQNLSMAEIEARLARWRQMGVDGVLFDDFGYDFGTGRARQNAAVAYAHGQGLAVIANAFRPADAFGSDIDPIHNPSGTAPLLGATDYYLYESHAVRLGEYEDGGVWRQKSDAVEAYRQALGFRVVSITTTGTDGPGAFDAARFFYAWHAALLNGHAATGWGEFAFSASGASNGQAPFRARPTLAPGISFTGPIFHAGTLHTRGTDLGRLALDTATHTYGFVLGSVAVPAGTATAGTGPTLAPNPVRAAARVVFTLERSGDVRLAVYDVVGRRIATLIEGELPAGRHETPWSGSDGAGRRLPPGSYFLALEAHGRIGVTRAVVAR